MAVFRLGSYGFHIRPQAGLEQQPAIGIGEQLIIRFGDQIQQFLRLAGGAVAEGFGASAAESVENGDFVGGGVQFGGQFVRNRGTAFGKCPGFGGGEGNAFAAFALGVGPACFLCFT